MLRPALLLRFCLFLSIQNFELPLLPRVFPPMTTPADLEFCFSLVFMGPTLNSWAHCVPPWTLSSFFLLRLTEFSPAPLNCLAHLFCTLCLACENQGYQLRSDNNRVQLMMGVFVVVKKAGLPRCPFPSKVCGLTSSERLHVFHRHEGNTIKSFQWCHFKKFFVLQLLYLKCP